MSIQSILAALACSALLCGCAASGSPAAADSEPTYFRLASTGSQNFVTNQALQLFCDRVREQSEGRIRIEPFFGGELGEERSILQQCAYGGVDFIRVSASEAASYAPLLNALQMPYSYDSEQHLFRVLDSEPGREVLESFDGTGLTGMTYLYAGYRCFFGDEPSITSLENMSGLRLRVSASQSMVALVQSWGAQTVSLNETDLALALRRGEVDGGEDNLPTYVDSGCYLLAPYWVYDRHTYNTDLLLASDLALAQLSEGDQALLEACAAEAVVWQREHWMSAEVRAMMRASRSGCYMALIDENTVERFRLAAKPLYDQLPEDQQKLTRLIGRYADT